MPLQSTNFPKSLYVKRNPLDEARASFVGDPAPSRFFPPVGEGENAFGGYISPGAAASSQMRRQAFDDYQDKRATEQGSNYLRRLEDRSKSRLMPYSEAASIAEEKAKRLKAESAQRLNPFMETSERERAQTASEESAAARRALPEKEQVAAMERKAMLEDQDFSDPGIKRLSTFTRDPRHYAAYEHFRDNAPPETTNKAAKQKYAFDQTVRMAQDEPVLNDLDDAVARGQLTPKDRAEVTEPVTDASGRLFGYRLKSNLTPEQHNNLAVLQAKKRREKLDAADAKEQRIAESASRAARMKSLDSIIDDIRAEMRTDASQAVIDRYKKFQKLREDEFEKGSPAGGKGPASMDDYDPANP